MCFSLSKAIAERNFSTEIFWFPFNSNPFHAGGLAKIAEKQEYAKSIVGTLASGATCLNLDTAVGAWNPNEDEIFIKEINMKPDGRKNSMKRSNKANCNCFIRRTGWGSLLSDQDGERVFASETL